MTIHATFNDASFPSVAFAGATGVNSILFPDNLASAFWLGEGSNKYLEFVSTNSSEAITLYKATTASAGLTVTSGTTSTGSASGTGLTGIGGATSGHGVTGTATNGHGGTFTGGSGGFGVYAVGDSGAAGVSANGGATGHGLVATGGGTSGSGVVATATNGHGGNFTGGSGGLGVLALGQGAGTGVQGTGGATNGYGVKGIGGATDGTGVWGLATGTGNGVRAEATGGGYSLYLAADGTSPVRAPLHIDAQDTQPTGVHVIGDIYVNATGIMYMCTVSGTPGTWTAFAAGSSVGDVIGPGSATDKAVARFNSTTGKIIQNSVVVIDDTGIVTGVVTVNNMKPSGAHNIYLASTFGGF